MPKFRVTGSSKETGARMTLELVAASKGDAERKATQSGMNVNHAAPMTDNHLEELPTMALKQQKEEGGSQKILLIVLGSLLAIGLILQFVFHIWW